MTEEKIRNEAYKRWEAEGRPDGQAERHWLDAEKETSKDGKLPETWSSDQSGGVVPAEETDSAASDAIPSSGEGTSRFKPGELASENK
ncbi:DUF2934 domain-containing protein [Rhizobium grahamii]|uniref:DUF2934 domain-containing protein n=1 Tax=Rhizobium grahamii CCGE 502 TaxID=990285 RepID=S3HEJ9_9HYPH|nr:DUF2934 domain-containing protein [Rhizobium grahamii]EPE96510.1 hypothetical protein RGCCGE502_20220 [Rhizobium grahamii CCGE 502]